MLPLKVNGQIMATGHDTVTGRNSPPLKKPKKQTHACPPFLFNEDFPTSSSHAVARVRGACIHHVCVYGGQKRPENFVS